MSTVQQQRPTRPGFSDGYPEEIAERLVWFGRELGVSDGRLLGLLGQVPACAPRLTSGDVDWQAVAKVRADEAWWAEAVLYDALALFAYDIESMRQSVSGSAARDCTVSGPGGTLVAASKLPAAERDRVLLTLVGAGGPAGRQALIAYLAQP
jgi:hypothetical protein